MIFRKKHTEILVANNGFGEPHRLSPRLTNVSRFSLADHLTGRDNTAVGSR